MHERVIIKIKSNIFYVNRVHCQKLIRNAKKKKKIEYLKIIWTSLIVLR